MNEPNPPSIGFLSKLKSRGKHTPLPTTEPPVTETDSFKQKPIKIQVGPRLITAEAVVPEAAALIEARQKASIETMDRLEAARAQIGEFCLTLGEGDGRAVMLNAGETEQNIVEGSSQGNWTKEWYTVFTKEGIRRVGLVSGITGDRGFDSTTRAGYLSSYRLFKEEIEKAKQTQAEGGINRSGGYSEQQKKGLSDTKTEARLNISGNYAFAEDLSPYTDIREVTDEGLVTKSLSLSIEQAQAGPKAQILSAKGTLNALGSVNKGLDSVINK